MSDPGPPRTEQVVSVIVPTLLAATLINERLTALGAQDESLWRKATHQ